MKALIILLSTVCFVSCSTYKSYQRVAADPIVDSREIILLGQKCKTVFPEKIKPPVLTSSGVDSAAYVEVVNAYNSLLDKFIQASEGDTIPPLGVIYKCTLGDSARIIRNFLRSYRPPPIRIRDTFEVEVTSVDAASTIELQRQEIIACRAENAKALMEKAQAEAKVAKKNANLGWFVGGALILALIAFLGGRISKKGVLPIILLLSMQGLGQEMEIKSGDGYYIVINQRVGFHGESNPWQFESLDSVRRNSEVEVDSVFRQGVYVLDSSKSKADGSHKVFRTEYRYKRVRQVKKESGWRYGDTCVYRKGRVSIGENPIDTILREAARVLNPVGEVTWDTVKFNDFSYEIKPAKKKKRRDTLVYQKVVRRSHCQWPEDYLNFADSNVIMGYDLMTDNYATTPRRIECDHIWVERLTDTVHVGLATNGEWVPVDIVCLMCHKTKKRVVVDHKFDGLKFLLQNNQYPKPLPALMEFYEWNCPTKEGPANTEAFARMYKAFKMITELVVEPNCDESDCITPKPATP